ncbi:MAG: hypothetical protein HDQ88_08905 [Clostridia bacterium]|nr:hypothetical protein [Clostridia bacterium]
MFYLIDVISDVCLAACKTRNDLHIAWLKYVQDKRRWDFTYDRPEIDFSQFTMNGKDVVIYHRTKFCGYDDDGNPIYEFITDSVLRRFRVLDEYGRTVDIREWPEMYEEPKWPKYEHSWAYSTGAKDHRHRMRGPAFGKQQNMEVILNEDDVPGNIDARKLQPRHKTKHDGWWDVSYYDRKSAKKWNQKNWKDNCKAKHQWAKHKKKAKESTIRTMRPYYPELDILDTIDDSWLESDPAESDMSCTSATEPDDTCGLYPIDIEHKAPVVVLTPELVTAS